MGAASIAKVGILVILLAAVVTASDSTGHADAEVVNPRDDAVDPRDDVFISHGREPPASREPPGSSHNHGFFSCKMGVSPVGSLPFKPSHFPWL